MSKTRLIIGLFFALCVSVFAFQAKAFTAQNKDSVYVGKDEVISSNFFAAGSSITVDGKVQGDIICAGRSIVINGFVDGDVLCAGQSITINGEVRGNVRIVGSSVTVNGKVARNVMAAGSDVNLGTEAEVGWDMLFAGAFSDIRGTVKRDVDGIGEKMIMGGMIGRNINLFSSNHNKSSKNNEAKDESPAITIAKTAVINGDLSYTAGREATIEDGATIKGAKTRHEQMISKRDSEQSAVGDWIWWRIMAIFSALLIGLILVSWLHRPIQEISERMFLKPYATFGYGLLVIFVTPLICILLLMTIIGIPVALILFVFWLIILYIAKIITAIVIGKEIMKRRKSLAGSRNNLIQAMVVGVVLTYILFSIPIIGWILSMIATVFGVGATWVYGREKSIRTEI